MWTYEQPSGHLYDPEGVVVGVGYSGAPGSVNDPEKQSVPDVGPIPVGFWLMGAPVDDTETGPYTIPLTPSDTTETFGRTELKIHGDDVRYVGQRLASKGCIVLALEERKALWQSNDHQLYVTREF